MKLRTAMLLCCLSGLLVFGISHQTRAQQDSLLPMNRVGVVSVMQVIQDSKRNADHIKTVGAQRNKFSAELESLRLEIESGEAQVQTLVPGSDDHLALVKEIMNKRARYKSNQEYYQQVAQAKERQWSEDLYKDILAATKKVAEELSLNMVFERTEPQFPIGDRFLVTVSTHKLMYHKGCLDITEHVLAIIDENK